MKKKKSPTNSRVKNSPEQMTRHHQPPKHPDTYDQSMSRILKRSRKTHEAYHLLFGNPRNFNVACEILLKDWWTDSKGNLIETAEGELGESWMYE